ncbi:MAG TPA: type II toxin-antitoxin system RelE/ParE family toxin [Planctomycetaceae bacterium]|jgi:hypothetical protein
MILRVLAEARLEAVEAAAWYDHRKSGLGDRLLDEIEGVLSRILTDPESLPIWEPAVGLDEIRRCVLKRFPYVVIFVCRPKEVVVVAISHARRRPRYWVTRLD